MWPRGRQSNIADPLFFYLKMISMDIIKQITTRYEWLKEKWPFPKYDDEKQRTPEYHNLTHLDSELRMCERILIRNLSKEKLNEMKEFVETCLDSFSALF